LDCTALLSDLTKGLLHSHAVLEHKVSDNECGAAADTIFAVNEHSTGLDSLSNEFCCLLKVFGYILRERVYKLQLQVRKVLWMADRKLPARHEYVSDVHELETV
jgi:hypothetical protein